MLALCARPFISSNMIDRYLIFLICSILMLSCRSHPDTNLEGPEQTLQLEQNLKPEDKFNFLISLTEKYPEEREFAKSYSSLTANTINLSDSILIFLLKASKGENSFDSFSRVKNVDKLYLDLLKLHSLGKAKIRDFRRKEKIDSIFAKTASSKGSSDWINRLFKDKSMIESTAEFRQIQTDCLVTRDLVFDDMIDTMLKTE
jgi:hypothetical protein